MKLDIKFDINISYGLWLMTHDTYLNLYDMNLKHFFLLWDSGSLVFSNALQRAKILSFNIEGWPVKKLHLSSLSDS